MDPDKERLAAPSRPWRPIASALLVLLPFVTGTLLIFGGGQVSSCLALGCPVPPPPPPTPFIGSPTFFLTVVLIVAAGWLIVAGIAIGNLWSADRARLGRATLGAIVFAFASALAIATMDLADRRPRRVVAEDAALFAVCGLLVAIPVVLGWAVLTLRRPASEPSIPPKAPPTARP